MKSRFGKLLAGALGLAVKEEEVLYPMMDEVLRQEAPALLSQARDVLHQP